jgi:hypothetical protein
VKILVREKQLQERRSAGTRFFQVPLLFSLLFFSFGSKRKIRIDENGKGSPGAAFPFSGHLPVDNLG